MPGPTSANTSSLAYCSSSEPLEDTCKPCVWVAAAYGALGVGYCGEKQSLDHLGAIQQTIFRRILTWKQVGAGEYKIEKVVIPLACGAPLASAIGMLPESDT